MKCNCEYCINFEYDDEYEEYVCTVDMDEDEVYRTMIDLAHISDKAMNIQ